MKIPTLFLLFILTISPGLSASSIILDKISYGKSFNGVPLVAFKVSDVNTSKNEIKKAIILTEGVHGNEYNGLLDSYITTALKSPNTLNIFSNFLKNNGVLYFIPKLNPDAVLKKSRQSAFGIDLNRDFKPNRLQAQETFIFVTWLDRELRATNAKLYMSIDYHCCGGVLLSPELSTPESLYKKQYEKISSLLRSHVSPKLTHSKSLKFWGKNVTGTLKDFLHKKYGSLSFTFEAKVMGTTKVTVSKHSKWWSSVANHIVDYSFTKQLHLSQSNSTVGANHLLASRSQADQAE